MTTNSLTSVLLIVPAQADHQEQVTQFLDQQQLLDPQQLGTNLLWFNQENEGLKIKTVREIIAEGSFSSYQGKTRIIVLMNADHSSLPAQNALLKILEEPPTNTLIILTTSQPEQLLPTIRSRCLAVHCSQEKLTSLQDASFFVPNVMQTAKQLLVPNFSYQDAIELATQYKDREEALELVNSLINHLHQQLQSVTSNTSSNNSNRQRHKLVLKQLLALYGDLGRNFNPQLAIEHHLFELVTA